MKLVQFILASILIAPMTALAASPASSSSYRFTNDYTETMPSRFRVGVLGGGAVMVGDTSYENKDNTDNFGYSGGLIAGFGKGSLSIEAGAMYMKIPSIASYQLGGDVSQRILFNNEYIGVPVWAKYNYIQKPLATFYVKAGAIPLFLMNPSSDEILFDDGTAQAAEPAGQDVLAVGGIGGTSPLNENAAFVLDLSAFYGLTEVQPGARNQGANISIGLSFDL